MFPVNTATSLYSTWLSCEDMMTDRFWWMLELSLHSTWLSCEDMTTGCFQWILQLVYPTTRERGSFQYFHFLSMGPMQSSDYRILVWQSQWILGPHCCKSQVLVRFELKYRQFNPLVKASSNFPKTWPSDQLARPGWWWYWQCMVVKLPGQASVPMLKPALALMYPNHCFSLYFISISLLEANIPVDPKNSYLKYMYGSNQQQFNAKFCSNTLTYPNCCFISVFGKYFSWFFFSFFCRRWLDTNIILFWYWCYTLWFKIHTYKCIFNSLFI